MLNKKVIIDIVNPEHFSVGCAEGLDNKTGTVTEYSEKQDRYLVEFVTPVSNWWTNQTPCTCFWFDKKNLKEVKHG